MSLKGPDSAAELETLARPLVELGGRLVRWTPWLVGLLAAVWLGSGVSSVAQNEVALVLRFGRLVGEGEAQQIRRPGLLLAWPAPIDRVVRVPVERVLELELVGLDRGETDLAGVSLESLPTTIDPTVDGYALTADRNVLQTRALVRYSIADPIAYALREQAPEQTLEALAQAALVRVLAAAPVDELLRSRRETLGRQVRERVQPRLDALGLGLRVEGVELIRIDPPLQLQRAFDEVEIARIEAARTVQQALAYRALELPRAEADARRAVADAAIGSRESVARARAAGQTFGALSAEAARAPEVVEQRLLEEARARVFEAAGSTKWVPADLENFRITISGGKR
ncbi:MAG: SPFH domain-containing protein [Planctomycetota bacterium]